MSEELTYAVGDIHGHCRLLTLLLTSIEEHAQGRRHRIVFLGDYIDRGPDSAGVVEILQGLTSRGDAVCLMGNHERLFLDAASGSGALDRWLKMGGDAALSSFGVAQIGDVPPAVVAWIASLPTFHQDNLRYFVHAGVDPACALDEQRDEDRLWIRGRFLSEDHSFGKFVVHGHTPQASGKPDLRPFRVNLDTAVGDTGVLTAAVFSEHQPGPVAFLQAREAAGGRAKAFSRSDASVSPSTSYGS